MYSMYFGHYMHEREQARHEHVWGSWRKWAEPKSLPVLPARPQDVVRFLSALPWKARTVERYAWSLRFRHRVEKQSDPISADAVQTFLVAIRRTRTGHPRRADAVTNEMLLEFLDACEPTLAGIRDQALLLLGWSAAMRCGELVSVRYEWLEFRPQGLIIRFPTSKTGAGTVAVPASPPLLRGRCPVDAVQLWLKASAIRSPGPLWAEVRRNSIYCRGYTDRSFRRLLSDLRYVTGYEGRFTGHSLRAGLVTTLARAGVNDREIARITRHKSMEVLRTYIRDHANPFALHPLNGDYR